MEEFFDLTKAFAFLDVPKGNNLAIITLSGGEGVLATDICETICLRMAQLSDSTYQRLKRIFPPWEIPLNPIDAGVCLEFHLSGIVKVFDGLKAIPEDEHVDCVVMQLPPDLFGRDSENEDLSAETFDLLKEEYTQAYVNIKRIGKPFALWRTSMDQVEDEWVEIFESHSLPVFQSSERAIKTLSALYEYSNHRMRETGSSVETHDTKG